jgi:hypothetical protein
LIGMAVTPPKVVRGPANRAFRFSVKVTTLIAIGGVAVIGQDFGWWGEKPLTCQQPGAQTTVSGDAKVVTAATIGQRQGEWLRKLNGPPPTAAEVNALADRAAEATVVYVAALTAAARDRQQSEYVEKYNRKRKVAKEKQLAQHIAMCSPSCPQAQPNGQPLTVANRGTSGEALARAAAQAAGFTGAHLEEAVAIARAESEFNPTAANPTSNARGMWQIMLTAHQDDPEIGKWRDPYANARMAYRISNGGTNWAPWSTWPAVRGSVGTMQPVAGGMTCASYQTTGKGPRVAAGAWGGYSNGRIPTTALKHPHAAPSQLLEPEAADAYDALSGAYQATFGHPLRVTDSYRSYALQVITKRAKGYLAATPGTSNHGWGLALDLNIGGYSSADYKWLRANAPRFGWDNPKWARSDGSKHESWHWEFARTRGSSA